MSTAANYQVEKQEILGVKVSITTYKIGEKFFCHIQNEDPGATIARAEGPDQETAKQIALEKATRRLS